MATKKPNPVQGISPDPDALLKTAQAAEFLNFTERTLEAWRLRGGGPAFVRVSPRAVRYRKCDLVQFAENRIVTSTSEMNGGAK